MKDERRRISSLILHPSSFRLSLFRRAALLLRAPDRILKPARQYPAAVFAYLFSLSRYGAHANGHVSLSRWQSNENALPRPCVFLVLA
jgi:hypothetical protein